MDAAALRERRRQRILQNAGGRLSRITGHPEASIPPTSATSLSPSSPLLLPAAPKPSTAPSTPPLSTVPSATTPAAPSLAPTGSPSPAPVASTPPTASSSSSSDAPQAMRRHVAPPTVARPTHAPPTARPTAFYLNRTAFVFALAVLLRLLFEPVLGAQHPLVAAVVESQLILQGQSAPLPMESFEAILTFPFLFVCLLVTTVLLNSRQSSANPSQGLMRVLSTALQSYQSVRATLTALAIALTTTLTALYLISIIPL